LARPGPNGTFYGGAESGLTSIYKAGKNFHNVKASF